MTKKTDGTRLKYGWFVLYNEKACDSISLYRIVEEHFDMKSRTSTHEKIIWRSGAEYEDR